jgi:hypothetical protein
MFIIAKNKAVMFALLRNWVMVFAFTVILFPTSVFGIDPVNLDQLVNKKWYILAMKCPGGVEVPNQKSTFMQYYFSLELKPAVYNNFTSGSYIKFNTDEDTNPRQEGNYKIFMDDLGRTLMTLTPKHGKQVVYSIKVVDENYLTLIRISESDEDRCRIHYAIAP